MTIWNFLLTGVALKSIVLLGAAGLVAIRMRRQSAAARHVLWTAAFAGLLALPLLTASLPEWYAPVAPGIVFQATASLRSRLGVETSEPRPLGSGIQGRSESLPSARLQPRRAAPLIFLLWFAGTAISLAQMAMAWLAVVRVRRKAPPFPGIAVKGVEVLESPAGSMPMTFGLLRPAILLPSDAAAWTAERRRVVLSHELAHIQRRDTATHLLARFALSLYWWNPLVWLAWRQFVSESERAADDIVLRAGARASDYASHLLEIARVMQAAPALGWAAVAMARRSQLEGRLLAILDPEINRGTSRRAAGWIAALAAVILIAPLAALRAQDTQTVPADVDATIRAAAAQKNHQMLDGAAQAAEAYRQYDLARKLLDSSLAIRAEVSGQGSVDYGLGLVKLGDLERDRHNFDEAEAFYNKAVTVLGNRPQAATALIDLGLLAMRVKQGGQGQSGIQTIVGPWAQRAFDYFQRAQAADPVRPGRALMWMAVVRDQQSDPAAANQLFQQALAAEGSSSAEAVTTMHVYLAFLERHGQAQEAKAVADLESAARFRVQSTHFRQRAGATPLRVGAGVAAPTVLWKVDPEYTEEAHAAKYQGTVVVAVTIDTDGTAQDMKVVRGLGLGLDEKALEAISQWKFKPGTKDGQPVPVMATIEVNFRLL